MKILVVADTELDKLWGTWSSYTANQLSGVELILSAGDLSPYYLEFLVTMVNVPLIYIRGNHDEMYHDRPPEGCVDIDGKVLDINGIRIAGLGGSKRYRKGTDMYTEHEMKQRIRKLKQSLRKLELRDKVMGKSRRDPSVFSNRSGEPGRIDILLTHAPCKGFGDLEDLPHSGFECFNKLLGDLKPEVQFYGHVHQEYGKFKRTINHPSGTCLINAGGMYILEI